MSVERPEVPEADAAEQAQDATSSASDVRDEVDAELRARGGHPTDRVSDDVDPVNPADAAEQEREVRPVDDDRR